MRTNSEHSVDLDRGIVRVVESLEQVRKAIRFKPTKTDKARGVTLPAFAVTELRRWKRRQAEELLALGIRLGGDTLVCGRADGTPHLPQRITFEFNRFIAKLALPRVTFHGLRHSHATQLLASGVSQDRSRASRPLNDHNHP
jgi:integrase